ncbi:MAG: sulfite exporter TauE/SafE family protein, partial [Planctomycetes bacterium]|nr:sulfite exporter TauE/SafE family protein [Planctomycetota bacterium]
MIDSLDPALLGAVLATSALGSLHCVGMCGPLVVSAAT